MHVVCTAGHVDHGKSALVEALTGMVPDRLDEERRRGLTIDLGFAWTDLTPSGGGPPATIAFIDLPGHRKFLGNMLAGAGQVRTALLVVAADDGWMPQSAEHLAILDLLEVRRGVVALTKTDLVDDEICALAEELVREELAGSALADAPLVAVSARTGAGLDALRTALYDLVSADREADAGRPRLWVDRAFTIRGSGTVVTGTLAGGSLSAGDAVELLPGEPARIRGLQSLQQAVDTIGPGSRVAVNLARVAHHEVPRGAALVHPGQWLAVRALDARIRVLPGEEVSRRGDWHLHVGSGEHHVTVHPTLATAFGEPGGFARLDLAAPIAVTAGDRFILREGGRAATVAGGVVLDPDPPPRPRGHAARERRVTQLSELEAALAVDDREALLTALVHHRGHLDAPRAHAAAGLPTPGPPSTAELVVVRGVYVAEQQLARWGDTVAGAVGASHAAHPLLRWAPREVAQHALAGAGCPSGIADEVLRLVAARGVIEVRQAEVRLPGHAVQLDPAAVRQREAVLLALTADPLAPPSVAEVLRAVGAEPELLAELEAGGDVVRLLPDLAMTAAAVRDAHGRLHDAYLAEGPLTASRAREILATTRKYALPLLEHLDAVGLTRRTGDVRTVNPPP